MLKLAVLERDAVREWPLILSSAPSAGVGPLAVDAYGPGIALTISSRPFSYCCRWLSSFCSASSRSFLLSSSNNRFSSCAFSKSSLCFRSISSISFIFCSSSFSRALSIDEVVVRPIFTETIPSSSSSCSLDPCTAASSFTAKYQSHSSVLIEFLSYDGPSTRNTWFLPRMTRVPGPTFVAAAIRFPFTNVRDLFRGVISTAPFSLEKMQCSCWMNWPLSLISWGTEASSRPTRVTPGLMKKVSVSDKSGSSFKFTSLNPFPWPSLRPIDCSCSCRSLASISAFRCCSSGLMSSSATSFSFCAIWLFKVFKFPAPIWAGPPVDIAVSISLSLWFSSLSSRMSFVF
mmetsp:Transcript_34477/g.55779  ORF Transcript_34477/g.55779 Transcript_34477/m.55779 type:complete len:345 (-) Transcript_34477:1070-2104(-)